MTSLFQTNGRRCEKLHRFLQDVLRAQKDLIWIDQIADQMRSKHLQFIRYDETKLFYIITIF